jgi:hypothetical protein
VFYGNAKVFCSLFSKQSGIVLARRVQLLKGQPAAHMPVEKVHFAGEDFKKKKLDNGEDHC